MFIDFCIIADVVVTVPPRFSQKNLTVPSVFICILCLPDPLAALPKMPIAEEGFDSINATIVKVKSSVAGRRAGVVMSSSVPSKFIN